MHKFPDSIIRSMQQSGAMITCVPVQFDGGIWESAVFFELGGDECQHDREILSASDKAIPVTLEAELIEHNSASVVMLRFEVLTDVENPLAGEVLIVPGLGDIQFETLKHLSEQQNLRFYFSDDYYNVIHSQQILLSDQERGGYAQILEQVISHDALIRLTGKYNAMSALSEIVGHYDIRTT